MKKARTLLILGIWVAVLPYLGFPYSWKDVLFSLSGLGLIYLSYVFYRELKEDEEGGRTFDNFRESNDFTKEEDGEMEIIINEDNGDDGEENPIALREEEQ